MRPCAWLVAMLGLGAACAAEGGSRAPIGMDASLANDGGLLLLDGDAVRPDRAEPSMPDVGGPPTPGPDGAPPPGSSAPLEVMLQAGRVKGVLENGARAFRGIPYAAPPLGALRFVSPQPVPPWAGTRDASTFGASCMQSDDGVVGPKSEDCLFLNVFTPIGAPQEPLPVLVFLHGGGITGGSAGYPGEWLVSAQPVVLVTVNYRLGPLASFVDDVLDAELGRPSGNLGLRDQQHALAWVQREIASFGGDPGRVLVFGESFGAMSACLHMFSPESAGLAQRFAMESGSCVGGHMAALTRADALRRARAVRDRVCPGVDDSKLMACLRSAPASALLPASVLELLDHRPYIDGTLLPDSPEVLLARGAVHDGPVLLGHNRREFAAFFAQGVPRPGDALGFSAMVTLYHPDHALALLDAYAPAKDADADEAFVALQTDGMFRCPTDRLAAGLADLGRAVFRFRFDVQPAVHALELDYVFGWPSGGVGAGYPEAPKPSVPSVVARVQRAWASFASDGVPDSSDPAWPRYDADAGAGLVLAQPASALHEPWPDALCSLWRTIDAR